MTFIVLMSYAWQATECFPGHDRVAGDISASPRSVHTYLGELEDAGLITIERLGKNQANIYHIEKWALPQ